MFKHILRKPGIKYFFQIVLSISLCLLLSLGSFGINSYAKENTGASIIRLAGENRYETAIQSADQLKTILGVKKFKAIVIASGVNFPDALAGSPLAAKLDLSAM